VPAGEQVLTSGGDGIFPKGLLVGRVTKVGQGNELFLNIRVRPAADLSRLEEVLVVTKIDERQAVPDQTGAARAVDILAERLPTVPRKPENAEKSAAPDTGAATSEKPASDKPTSNKPASAKATTAKPAGASMTPASDAKPKPLPVDGSATKPNASEAMQVSPKPSKTGTEAKPQTAVKSQPAVEDSPH
jgi:rod shape-determining protein MreC